MMQAKEVAAFTPLLQALSATNHWTGCKWGQKKFSRLHCCYFVKCWVWPDATWDIVQAWIKILPIQWPPTNHIFTIYYLTSLGAGICFEAARYLKLHYNMQPVHVLISSATAPQVSRSTLWLDKDWRRKIAWDTKRASGACHGNFPASWTFLKKNCVTSQKYLSI